MGLGYRKGCEGMTAPYYGDELVTLYHGDCLDVTEWLAADVLITDPPYGIAWKKGENKRAKSAAHAGILNDSDTTHRDAALALFLDKPGAVFGSWRAAFPKRSQTLIWRKPGDAGVVGSVTGFRNDTELIFLTGNWPKRNSQWSSVITTDLGMHSYLNGHCSTAPHCYEQPHGPAVSVSPHQSLTDHFCTAEYWASV